MFKSLICEVMIAEELIVHLPRGRLLKKKNLEMIDDQTPHHITDGMFFYFNASYDNHIIKGIHNS